MKFLSQTSDGHEANLAVDAALLDEAEAANQPRETLRIWESKSPLVVVGYSSHIDREVRKPASPLNSGFRFFGAPAAARQLSRGQAV